MSTKLHLNGRIFSGCEAMQEQQAGQTAVFATTFSFVRLSLRDCSLNLNVQSLWTSGKQSLGKKDDQLLQKKVDKRFC